MLYLVITRNNADNLFFQYNFCPFCFFSESNLTTYHYVSHKFTNALTPAISKRSILIGNILLPFFVFTRIKQNHIFTILNWTRFLKHLDIMKWFPYPIEHTFYTFFLYSHCHKLSHELNKLITENLKKLCITWSKESYPATLYSWGWQKTHKFRKYIMDTTWYTGSKRVWCWVFMYYI